MKRVVIFVLVGVMVAMTAMAQAKFRTTELKRLSTVLALDVNQLPEGYSHPKAHGLPLTIHQNNNTIDHIGLHLFSDEIRMSASSPIFDFLERYFLQLKYPPTVKTSANMIRDDKFQFIQGSMTTIDGLRLTDDFSFNNDNHRYTATWQRNGRTILSVSFPVEYELISGENKIEAEENLQADIQRTTVKQHKDNSQQNDCYINESFSNRLYYRQGHLLIDSNHPAESLANLMLSTNAKGNYNIQVTQVSYGFKKKVFQVPLCQWIAFCQNNGCQLYYGVDNINANGEISAVVIAVNEAENYNHVLTITISSKVIGTGHGVIDARLFPYVPTHNVMNMFANYRKTNPKNVAKR